MQRTFCPFQLGPSWQKVLKEELKKTYITELAAFLEGERARGYDIFPPEELIFNAFYQTPYNTAKVVIVGQDPYHGPGQAHGLSFSVPAGVTPPPSLKNIYKELENDLAIPIPNHGTLTKWAEQGVLLLNATLTVRKNSPLSHHGKGWETFTDAAIKALSQKKDPTVFLLWGKYAQEKCRFLMGDVPRGTNEFNFGPHLVLLAAHPSPFSCHKGFFDCRHFSKVNNFLVKTNQHPVTWAL